MSCSRKCTRTARNSQSIRVKTRETLECFMKRWSDEDPRRFACFGFDLSLFVASQTLVRVPSKATAINILSHLSKVGASSFESSCNQHSQPLPISTIRARRIVPETKMRLDRDSCGPLERCSVSGNIACAPADLLIVEHSGNVSSDVALPSSDAMYPI